LKKHSHLHCGKDSGYFVPNAFLAVLHTPLVLMITSHLGLCFASSLKLKLNSVALVRERNIPTKRLPLVDEVVTTFADRLSRVVSATNSHGR
jgi:hypothetical protein